MMYNAPPSASQKSEMFADAPSSCTTPPKQSVPHPGLPAQKARTHPIPPNRMSNRDDRAQPERNKDVCSQSTELRSPGVRGDDRCGCCCVAKVC